jgi:NADH:ubiquinone oxidoreductase subunit 6 (subunit J)
MLEKKKMISATIVLFILFVAAPALAVRDAGEIARGLTTQADLVGSALVAIGVVIGIFVIIWGFMQLKNAGSRGDASVGKGLAAIVVGICLVCIIAFSAMGSKTIFGDESSMSDRISSF